MNYKYEVGASFPCKLLRKGEAQSQVQSERKQPEDGPSAAKQKTQNSMVLSSEESTTNIL